MHVINGIFLTVEIITIILCLITNIPIILAIYTSTMMDHVSYQFILLMSFSNIGIGLCTIPLDIMISLKNIDLSFDHCILTQCLTIVFVHVSTLLLLMFAIERFLAIRCPYFYCQYVDVHIVRYAGLGCFILGFLIAMAPTVSWNIGSENYETMLNRTCSYAGIVDRNFLFIFDFGITFVAPAIVMCVVFSYLAYIVHKLKKQDEMIQCRFSSRATMKSKKGKLSIFVAILAVFVAVRVPLFFLRYLMVFEEDLICSLFGLDPSQKCRVPDWYYVGVMIYHFESVRNVLVLKIHDQIRIRVLEIIFKREREHFSERGYAISKKRSVFIKRVNVSYLSLEDTVSNINTDQNDKKMENKSTNLPAYLEKDDSVIVKTSSPIQNKKLSLVIENSYPKKKSVYAYSLYAYVTKKFSNVKKGKEKKERGYAISNNSSESSEIIKRLNVSPLSLEDTLSNPNTDQNDKKMENRSTNLPAYLEKDDSIIVNTSSLIQKTSLQTKKLSFPIGNSYPKKISLYAYITKKFSNGKKDKEKKPTKSLTFLEEDTTDIKTSSLTAVHSSSLEQIGN